MTAEADTQRGPITFEPRTEGLRMLPTRLAIATVSLSRFWWIFLVVLIPLSFLIGSLWVSPQIANGVVGISGFLALALWSTSHYNYDGPRIQINSSKRTLTVTHRNAGHLERTVNLDKVESVSIRVLDSMTLIRIEEHRFSRIDRLLLPEPFLVPTERLPMALDAISMAGVTVPDTDHGRTVKRKRRPDKTTIRLAVTPLTLAGVPLYCLYEFGQAILVTNGTVIVVVLGVIAIVQEFR